MKDFDVNRMENSRLNLAHWEFNIGFLMKKLDGFIIYIFSVYLSNISFFFFEIISNIS